MNITGTNTPLWCSDHDIVIKTGSHRVYKVYSISGTSATKKIICQLYLKAIKLSKQNF